MNWLNEMIADVVGVPLSDEQVQQVHSALLADVFRSGVSGKSKDEIRDGIKMARDIVAATRAAMSQGEADAVVAELSQREVFDRNKAAILAALKGASIDEVEVKYEGSGDDGGIADVDYVHARGEDAKIDGVMVEYLGWGWVRDPSTGRSCQSVKTEAIELDEAVRELCDDAIALMGHSGWEDNDGGCGTLTIDAVEGTVVLEHTDYFTDSSTEEHPL